MTSLIEWFGASPQHAVVIQTIICTFFAVTSIITIGSAMCENGPTTEIKPKMMKRWTIVGFVLGGIFVASMFGLIGLFV